MNYTLSQIAQIVKAVHTIIHQEEEIQAVYFDTRQISIPQRALFVAIESHKNDGHKYIHDAYQKGIRNFLVQYLDEKFFKQDANYIVVAHSIQALQIWAKYHRQLFNIPVIGITGSNGKTIVKEWLYFLLKDEYNICRSPRSFNSQIGVPISVLNLNDAHQLAIFEAGISLPQEMEKLESIIQPDIAILTHFGTAHSEGFSSDEEKLKEKLKLFAHSKINIIQKYHHSYLQSIHIPIQYIGISENPTDVVYIEQVQKMSSYTQVNLYINKQKFSFRIPFVDEASIKNAITCFVCIYFLNAELIPLILSRFAELPVISLRLEVKKGKFQSHIINDYYNSDIDSFEIAMSYFHQYQSHKVLILSDFEQVKNNDEIYQRAIQIIHTHTLKHLILIGNEWKKYLSQLLVNYTHYVTTADFINNIIIHSQIFFDATILIKGARRFEFEKIAQQLELKTHETILEIHIPALWHNLRYYKNIVGKNVKIMCMLKAAGYGSGSVEMAYALQKFGIDYIAVAYTDEGVELKQANIQLPIMVMLPEKNSFKDIIQYQLEPEIYSFEILNEFIQELEKQGIYQYPVHIKIDTGMHRLGFLPQDIPSLIHILSHQSHIVVRSIFSHFAASESDEHRAYTFKQIQLFDELSKQIETHLSYKTIRHICNSAAVNRYPQAHFDMIRIGIGMYGISDDWQEEKYLQNVLCLKTRIAQIKTLKKGDSVGYNRNTILDKDSEIAVIPIGYADGFSRKLGNKNFQVKYKEHLVPTIGNVCMDMTMIDVSHLNAVVGDEIIIFNSQEDIKKMAKHTHTIPYEVLTSISQRVKRIYIYE